MKKTIAIVLLSLLCVTFVYTLSAEKGKGHSTKNKQGKVFGAEPSLTSVTPISLDEALLKENLGKTVRLKAHVIKVCKVKGCWMIIQSAKNSARVTFKDYGFFVPKNSAGKKVILEGIMTETVITEADARHYAEDDGKSKKEIEKIKGDQKEYSFVATSVTIL